MIFRKSLLLVSIHLMFFFTSTGAQPALRWRIFKSNNISWLVSPSDLLIFSSATRTIRPMTIDPVRKVSFITDVVESEDFLFVSTDVGLYKIDKNTQSSERISFPDDQIIQGKIAVDMDYIWLADSNNLYSYDRLGTEWQSYKIPGESIQTTGISSNGEDVICIGKTVVNTFAISTEKWNTTKINDSISDSAVFFNGNNTLTMIDNSSILRYMPSSYSWETTVTESIPRDYLDEDSVIYYVVGTKLMKLTTSTNVVRPLDIPQTGEIYAFSKISDTLLIAAQKRIVKYNINSSSMDFIEYTIDLDASTIEKITFHDKFLIVICKSFVALYDTENRSWQKIARGELKQKIKAVTWDDKGFITRYAPGYQSSLTGSIEENFSLRYKGFKYDTTFHTRFRDGQIVRDTILDSTRLFGYTLPSLPLMNLNFRTTDPHDRSLEMLFNNTSLSTVPSKGLTYQGNRDDRLNSVKVGSTSSNQLSSPTLPTAQLEGGSIIIDSKKRIKERDRKILRIAAGSGLITTQTRWRTLPFRSNGTYKLSKMKNLGYNDLESDDDDTLSLDSADVSDTTDSNKDTTRIVPGSVLVWIDGEPLDSTKYTFYSRTGKLQFTPDAPVDPVSIITIQYKIQTIPDGGINEVELLPKHNFGLLNFGSVSLAPNEWISARVGYAGLDADTLSSSKKNSPILNASVPLEIRKDKFILKFAPEYSYNTQTGAMAGSALLQSRFGSKTGFVFNGMFADNEFVTTDSLSYGYGAVRNQYDFTLSHDITNEMPVSYYQHRREAENGIENRFSAQAGVHIPERPFLDLTLSRISIEHVCAPDSEKTAFDSLFDTKDKMKIRLYETSSKILTNLTHAKKISYDLSHSEYRYESGGKGWRNGRMSTAEVTVAPIQRITLSGNLIYQGGIEIDSMPSAIFKPNFELQTIDAPKGVDFNASYYLNYGKFSLYDSSTDSITRSMNIILKPGMWFPVLRWISPRAAISQVINCAFSVAGPDFWEILTGSNSTNTSNLQKSFGFNIYPTNEILIRNNNEFSELDSGNTFKTTNDIQLWLGTRNFWQAIWNFSTKNNFHNGSLIYDRILTSWLRTSPSFTVTSMIDSIGTRIETSPALKININLQNFWFVKILSNSHDLKLLWTKYKNNSTIIPQIGYTFNLTLLLMPNIQLNNFETIVFKDSKMKDFQSRLSMIVNF
ncbi:MAG TPA: hypothetical protein VHP36_00560 [Chitinispirillaceae bacterium]|nr:hypothetical protein [Chitinispirillaceae bacterium]HEX3018754.1 hypothetical protein [Chitinispirillaceae bacterium]